MTANRRLLVFSFLILALFPVLASAATIEFRTLIDVDNNGATGCSAAGMTGVEHVVVTVVKTDATSGAVDRSYRLACSGGSFGSPLDVNTSGWPVGFNAASGGMLVENRIAFSILGGGMPSGLRLGFDASTGSSTHSATATSTGAAIIYPKRSGKRHAVAGPGGDARFFQLDGNGTDWGAIEPVVNGIAGGGTAAIRMIKAFAYANATDEFVYFRVDANGGSDAPFAEDDQYSRAVGQATLSVAAPGVLANDGDPNGQPLTALPVSPAAHGDVTLNADGSFTYSPADPSSSQTDSFHYKATNGAQESNVAKVTIKVSSVANNAPVAVNDSRNASEDQTLNVGAPGVLGNDSDADGDTITATKLTDPSNGSVVVNPDGSFTYTPDPDFFGTDTFTYEVSDGEFTSVATVTITVESVNDAPTVSPATFSVNENAPNGTAVGIVNMNDVDTGDSHGYAITAGNTGGVFAISNSGQITVANNAALDFEVTPSYSLTVTVTDNGIPSQSGSATITITVNDQNEAPVAVNDAATIPEDGNVNVVAPGLLANDTDQEGDTLTATKLTDPSTGTATVAVNGAWTYQPNANFNGTDSFTYQVSDGTNTSNIATVTITVTAVNDTPSFTAGPNVASDEDTPFSAPWATGISAGPADEAGQTLTFNVNSDNPALFQSGPTISSTGVLSFTPALNAIGVANVTVSLSDNGGGANTSGTSNFTITVNAVNDAPSFTAGPNQTVNEDAGPQTVNPWATGITPGPADEAGQTVAFTITNNTNPALFTSGPNVSPTGVLTYQPAVNASGVATITLVLSDNGSNVAPNANTSAAQTFTITINAANDAPVNTVPGAQITGEDTPLVLAGATAISVADLDAGTANIQVTVSVTNGTLTITSTVPAGTTGNGTASIVMTAPLAAINTALDGLRFDPAANYTGAAVITIVTNDLGNTGSGGPLSDTDTVNITVNETNDAPTANADGVTTPEDVPLAFAAATLTTNDSAGPANESGQTLTVTAVSPTSTQGGTVTLVGGTITYTPAVNFNGTDTFTYTVTDNGTTNGAADPRSAVGTVTVTVTEVNDAPVATDDATAATEDTPLAFAAATLTTNDSAGPANESGQTLTVTGVSATSAQGGTVTLVAGTITYTPPANYFGADSFTYTVTDNGTTNGVAAPLTDTGTVNVTVSAVNDPPALTVAGAVTHTEGGAATNVATAANIADVDDTNIESATVRISANFAAGQDVLSFVNTPQITASFVGDTLTLTGSDTLANYTAALQAIQYTNTSDAPSTLQRTITWTVNDGTGNSNTQNTTLDVTATNDGPVNSVPGAQAVSEDTPLTFSTANGNPISIADADANPDDVQVTLNVTNGTVTLNPAAIAALTTLTGDGTGTVVATGTVAEINAALDGMIFQAIANYTGAASIQIVTNDLGNNPSGALSDTDTVAITVNQVNDPSVLTVTGAVTHTEGGAATNLATAANITDVDDTNIESATIRITGNYAGAEDVLSFVNTPQITGSFAGDTLTLTGSDTLANYIAALQAVQYTNTSDTPSTLQRTITWTVNDGDSNSNTQTTTLDVTATNDGPVNTVAVGVATDEDTPVVINGASIADADAASDDVQITLNVTGGTVTLDATATGALTSLTGDGTATVTATGTVAEINNALGGMTFSPTANTNGTASIQMVTDDLGNNPSGPISDTDSFNITVNAVNDAPVLTVTGAPVTFPENGSPVTPAAAVNITDVDDTNIESATISISANFQALDVLIFADTPNITGSFVGSTLTLTGSDTLANYIAALQSITFSHGSDNPSTAQRTITWTVNDGTTNSNTQNTTVDVTASNDAPVNTVAVGAVTDEDVPLTINGASIADADADPDDVQITLNVTSGTVALDPTATGALASLTGNGTATVVATGTVAEINAALSGMVFTPTADFSGTAAIEMVTNDLGNNPSGAITDTDSFNITVNNVNDAPALTVTGAPTFAENGPAVAIASSVNITDADDTNIESATITITNVQAGDTLNFVNTVNITGNFAAGVLTLTGSDTKAAYISALQSITFSNASDNPSITQRAITWVVNDGDVNSNTRNTTVDVTAINDAPVNTVAAGVATNEDTPVVINGASISDPDADPDDVQITLNVTSGTVALDPTATGALTSLTGDGSALVVATGTVAEINAALSGMTFTPTANFNGTASIQMATDDLGNNPSGAITDTDSFNITVNAVNDPPSFTPGADVTVPEDSGSINQAWATSISKGPADENGQTLTFTATVTGTTGTLSFFTAPSVSTSTGNLSFQANANTCGTATVDVTLTDDGGGTNSSSTHTLNLTIQCVNDAPSFTKGPDQTVNEDAAAQTINPWATAISPGPGETDALTFNVSNDNNPLFTAGGQPAVSATGVLTYTPAPNANGTTIVTVTLTDDAGTPGVPGDDNTTAPQTFNITINALNDAPSFSIAGDPPFIVLGGGAQTVNGYATSINDGDPELTQVLTFNLTQTGNSGTLAFDAAPAIDPATGNLTYTPTAGTHGTVTFSVTLSDDGATGGSNVNVSGAQSFTIAVEKAPEVTTTVPADNATGVSTSTNITVNFDEPVSVTLSPASFKINCNAGADLAFAYVGSTTNVTTVTLDPTATLPAGNCVVTVVANEVHDTDAYDPPDGLAVDYTFDFITNTPPVAGDDANTALGHVTLTVSDASGVLVNDTDPDAGADMDIQNFGTPITTTQGGTITFTKEGGYTYNSQALDQNITDTVTYTVTDQFGGTDTGTLTINLGPRFIYVDDDHPTVTPDGRDIHPWKTMQQAQTGSAANDTILVKSGNYTDHIVLQSGQSLIGQGISANHTHTHNAVIFTVLTAGAAPTISRAAAGDTITLGANNIIRGVTIGSTNGKGIVGNNFGTLTVNDNVIVSANGNAALHLDTGAVTATFNSVSATSGANSGLIFNALTGTMNINGGNISNTAGATLNLTGGSMAGTIAANISTTGTSLINVASRTANALTLSGALSGNGTIAASGNAAGTTLTFSGTQTLNTGTNVGVNLSANPGTISFTSGALQIATTSGAGFIASGATGNVNVTGANNTISTGTGVPLQMTGGVDIGASGVTFRSISAIGAASGIVLADTGANAFTLAGTGTAGTGGTLQSIVGTAVSLTNTNSVNLNHLTINGAGTGIGGTTFGTLTLRDLAVTATSGLNLNTGTVNNAAASNAFTSLTSTGGTNGVALTAVAGTFHIAGGSSSGATGATLLVSGGTFGGTWANTFSQANNAAVMSISDHATGTIAFNGTVTSTHGTGIQFTDADGTYNFGTVDLNDNGNAASNAGIDVLGGDDLTNGSQGTFTFGSGSNIDDPTGSVIDIQGSKPAFTYNGTFAKSSAGVGFNAVGNQGGTITITGTTKTLNTSTGTAVNLDNNDNCSITFSGGNLDIDTTSGIGFSAINGGTVVVSGTNNTVNSTANIGVRVTDTTIGVNDMAWLSVNAAGGANGINLTNTGNIGTFTVLGNNTLGSGGTISNTTGDGILLSNAHNVTIDGMNITNSAAAVSDQTNCHFENASGCSSAIDIIASSSNIILDQIVIDHNDGGQTGITGDGVNNLTVTNTQILEVGNADAESAVILENAAGDVFFTDVTIDDPAEYGIRVFQTNASLDLRLTRVTVQNNLAKTFGEQGFSIRATGTSVSRVLVDDSDFLNTDGIGVDGQAIDSAQLHLTIQNTTFTENRALPMAVNFTTDNTSQGFVKIHNNVVTDPAVAANGSVAFDLDANRTSTLHSIITNNVINGTGIGTAIELLVGDGSTGRAEVRDNTLTLNNDEIGMTFQTRYEGFDAATNARLDVIIEGNTVNNVVNPGGTFIPGVQLLAGSSVANPHTGTVCVNTAVSALAGNNSINGTNSGLTPKFEIRQRTGTTFQLQGFTGTGTNAASVASHFDSNNSGTAGPAFVGTGGTNILNYTAATCNTPTTPTLPN